jgi:2-polyprenyl-3-methyl-5-hydroxy-6-metoxy-1,4-benzoquinol methylase
MIECKFCGKKKAKIEKHIKSPYSNLDYNLYKCKDCCSKFFDYKEHGESFDKTYNKEISYSDDQKIKLYKAKDALFHINNIIKCLGHYPISVLDVGCSWGDFLIQFDSNIVRDGVELSESRSQIAKYRGLNIFNKKIEYIKFKHKYEVVTAFAIIEHLENPLLILDELCSIVENKGILMIMIPTIESAKCWIIDKFTSKRWHQYCPPEHYNFPTKKFLDSYLLLRGFKLANRYCTSGYMYNPFKNIPILGFTFGKIIYYYDRSIFNKISVFDHQYSIYQKVICSK